MNALFKMEELEINIALSDLDFVMNQLNYYKGKIKQSFPHRDDLISKFEDSIKCIQESLSVAFKMKIIMKQLEKMNGEWSLKYYETLREVKDLTKQVEDNKVNLDYLEELERENIELKKKVELLVKEL
jgi:hypothetical protein